MNTFELNNIRKDADIYNGNITKHSPVVEVFAAMTKGESLQRFGKKADVAVNYIKNLSNRADNGDFSAVAELNTIRRFVIEAPVMEELKLLGIFGTYQNVGFDETIEMEVYKHVSPEFSRVQANGGDVVFPAITKEIVPVATTTISGGYAVDYRRVALGDMTRENEGMNLVKTDILNRAKAYVVKKIYEAVVNATGVKYVAESAGLNKSIFDKALNNVRRYGKPTFVGDYALISQLNGWSGYVGTINSNTITGISQNIMNEIAATGAVSMYNGAIVAEMANPYNEYKLNAAGDNYDTMLPTGLGFIIPTGVDSPVRTFSRGGLTSMTGSDVKSGKNLVRFDIEVGAACVPNQENHIAIVNDTNLGTF